LEILPVLGTTSGQGLDIGSGAGFPGLVLAVVRPDWAWTLLEARGRRAAFLEGTIRALGVSHVAVVAARAEEWIREVPDQRERFDVVTLRAVGGARMSLELGLPFVKVGGKLVLVKSFEGRQEVEAERAWMEELGGHLVEWRGGPLRDERGRPDQIGVVAKVQRTPLAYPRRAAKLGR
jgi:16S rRNA (guanine527-N7)-methyltransferase